MTLNIFTTNYRIYQISEDDMTFSTSQEIIMFPGTKFNVSKT